MNTFMTIFLTAICVFFFAFLIIILVSKTIVCMFKNERCWPYALGAAIVLPILVFFMWFTFPSLY